MSSSGTRAELALRINRRVFYGWVVLGVGALGFFASGPGQSHTFSVFVGPISEDLGISSTAIATAYAVATLVAAFGLPQMGRLIDRFGPRGTATVVAALLGLACIAFGMVANVLWLALGFAALRFLGQGSLMLNCTNLVAQWFSRRRGFAMSLLAMGFAASMAAHPALAQWLTSQFGWREAWLWMGLITWALLLPPILLLVHNRPEDLGLNPDGAATPPPGSAAEAEARHSATAGLTLKEALRTSAFWIIVVGLFSLAMLVTSLFFFQVSIFEAQGLSRQTAARVFSVSAVTMVLAMPAIGHVLDRYRTEWVFAGGLVVMATSLVAVTLVSDLASAIAYGVVFGINNAASLTLYGYMWPRYFGRRYLGSIQGTGQMIGVVGASVGPLPLGIAFDLVGSYTETLLALALLPLACAVLALFLRPPALVRAGGAAS